MNLYDLSSGNTIINIDGIDIEMKHPICFGKEYDKWLVSKCGKVWSMTYNRLLHGHKKTAILNGKKYLQGIDYQVVTEKDWWGDGSGCKNWARKAYQRHIPAHKMIIDTWAPLWDNPPKEVSWEQWEIVRELDTVYDYFNKSGSIDHIDDNPANNHVDNLRRVNDWDNNYTRKAKGI
jgi:hypothetical protein